MTAPRAFLCGTAKNEAPYILEWVAHHLELGFTDIALYQNDSDDLTQKTLKTLAAIGAIQYFDNPAKRSGHQVRAYMRASKLPAYREADFAMALDLDELLVVKTGDGRLTDLIAALPEFDLLMANWRIFGSSGHKMPGFQLQAERFTKADYALNDDTHFNAYKALFRPGLFSRPGIHKPPEAEGDMPGLRVVNGSGLSPDRYQVKNYNSTDPGGQSLVQINHYVVRDLGSFLVKTRRGSAHQDDRVVGVKYWAYRNRNFVEDQSIQPWLPRIRARMQALDAASDGRLMRLRRHAIARHRQKIEDLLQDPEIRALREDCLKFEGHVPLWGSYHDHL